MVKVTHTIYIRDTIHGIFVYAMFVRNLGPAPTQRLQVTISVLISFPIFYILLDGGGGSGYSRCNRGNSSYSSNSSNSSSAAASDAESGVDDIAVKMYLCV